MIDRLIMPCLLFATQNAEAAIAGTRPAPSRKGDRMAADVIADIAVADPDAYEEYRRQVPAVIEKYGGRYLVRGGASEVFEGDWQPNRLILLEFPDSGGNAMLEVLQVIVFNLKCAEGHGFEEWFASSADYEAKAAARALVCPESAARHLGADGHPIDPG
jgi:uncharacterized protein (DUF1330 family)